MIEQLFGSKTRVKLLKLFYGNPNRSFFVREITRKIDEQINSVRRELANLLSIGIISSDNTDSDNKLFYEVNQKYEFYAPLSQIFGGAAPVPAVALKDGKKAPKTDAPVVSVAATDSDILSIGNIDYAIYTGQFTRDETSGIDVLIVGDVNPTKLNKFIADLEQKEGKELRFASLTPDEFAYRKEVKDRFISNILASKKQVLVDKHSVNQEVKE